MDTTRREFLQGLSMLAAWAGMPFKRVQALAEQAERNAAGQGTWQPWDRLSLHTETQSFPLTGVSVCMHRDTQPLWGASVTPYDYLVAPARATIEFEAKREDCDLDLLWNSDRQSMRIDALSEVMSLEFDGCILMIDQEERIAGYEDVAYWEGLRWVNHRVPKMEWFVLGNIATVGHVEMTITEAMDD